MKIAFISDQFFPRTSADSEQIISSLSALSTLADVSLISACYRQKKPATKKELEVYYQEKINFKIEFIPHLFKNIRGIEKLSFALRSARKIRNSSADVVYTRNIPVLICILLGTNLPVFFESYRPWPSRNFLSKWFFKKLVDHSKFGGVILHSNFAGKSFRNVGFCSAQLIVAHNAVNIGKYGNFDRSETLKFFDLPEDKIIVTYSGRVTVDKGLMRIFDLADEFRDVLFLVVGSEEEGLIEEKAKEFTNVKVLPWQDKKSVYRLLTASDILYIPNSLHAREKAQNTVLPLKTFLYKASGIPIVAPNIEDIVEVLTHMKTAVLVEPDNLEKEKEAFELLIKDEDLRRKIGANAQNEMKDLTWKNRANNILSFIHKRLEKK
jgi:glycosyltransferase involved in cell wall biosynthesis